MCVWARGKMGLGGGLARWIMATLVASITACGSGVAWAQMTPEPWMEEEGGYQAPSQPQEKVQADAVYTTTQTNTEIWTSTGEPPAVGTLGVGLDLYVGEKRQTYTLPLSYNLTHSWGIEAIVPFVVANHRIDGEWTTDRGLGDLVLTAKNRTRLAGAELQSIVSAKLATGNEEKEMGTGAYDFSLTEKLIVPLNRARLTFMVGYTYRGDDARIDGDRVDYGNGFAWMLAVDANVLSPSLWLGLRATGFVQGQTEVEGVPLDDRLFTADLAPEVKYFVTANSAITVGVFVPVYTEYEVKGDDPREVTFNAGIFSLF